MVSKSVGALFLALLVLPSFAGCTILDRDREWELQMPLGILVSPRVADVLEDVPAAAELATRQWTDDVGVGVRYTLHHDAAADGVAAAYDRLVGRGVAAVVAAVAPDEAALLVQRAAQARVPLLLATPPASPLSAGQTASTLQLAADPAAEAGALAALVEAEGVERVLLLRTSDIFAAQLGDAFAAALNGTVVDTSTFERDAAAVIGAAARGACDREAEGVVILAPGRETGWIVRGLRDAGCLERLRLFASSSARQPELVEEARIDPNGRSYAAGLLGVEPANSRLPEFRALFLAETGRPPGPYGAEAYDAVSIATLAAFAAHASRDARPVEATVTAEHVRENMVDVAEEPGVKLRDRPGASGAAKRGDTLDWIGYAHDFRFDDANTPVADAWDRWAVTRTGAFERQGSI